MRANRPSHPCHAATAKTGANQSAQLTAITHQWGAYYTQVAQAVLHGTWKPKPVWGSMREGFVALAPFAASVPKDVAVLVDAQRSALLAGRLKLFSAPLVYTDALGAYRAGDSRPIIERFSEASRFAAHSGTTLVDQLAEQVAQVPLDQHFADVEDDSFDRGTHFDRGSGLSPGAP